MLVSTLVDDIWQIVKDWIINGDITYFSSYIGCLLLSFHEDEHHIAAHSDDDQWQKRFGYCDLYDTAFRIGTDNNIRILKLPTFNYNEEEYIFWCWRGTYLNLGSGAEIGFYYKPRDLDDLGYDTFLSFGYLDDLLEDILHLDYYSWWWAASPYELTMELDLYTKKDGDFACVSSWHPYDRQWWITSFNYSDEHLDPYAGDLYVVAKICFETATYKGGGSVSAKKLYSEFKASTIKARAAFDDPVMLIFDDHTYTVYMVWGDDIKHEIYTTS